MSRRPTSSAFRRSRSAASSAVSQPGSMWMLRPQALQAVEAVLGQPGLELALGLHLLLQRLQRVEARRQVGLLARSRALTWPAAARRSLVERGHLLLQLVQARLGGCGCASLGAGALALAGRRGVASSGAARPCCSAGQALAPRLQLARSAPRCCGCSAASTWICCCTCATTPRCSLAARLRLRAARLRASGSCARLLLDLRGQQRRPCSSASAICAARRLELGLGVGLAALRPLRVLRLQLGQALLDALAAFDHVADALLEPAHLERGFGQRALRCVQLRRRRRSAPGGSSRARPRRGAARPRAPRARWRPRRRRP